METTVKHLYAHRMILPKYLYGKNLLTGALARKNIASDGSQLLLLFMVVCLQYSQCLQ
jgi:hypothetical protein